MSRKSRFDDRPRNTYAEHTRKPVHSLIFVAPLLIAFHWGAARYGTALLALRDLDRILRYFGATTPYLPPLLILAVLLIQQYFYKGSWKIQPKVLAGMLCESIAWTIPLVVFSHFTGRRGAVAAATLPGEWEKFAQKLMVAAGAGLYEEFLFRLVLVSGAMLLFVDVFEAHRDVVAVVAVVLSAVAFSVYHLTGPEFRGWAGLPWGPLIFRTLAGMYLGFLYVKRGYGVAVWTHALFDVYVLVGLQR